MKAASGLPGSWSAVDRDRSPANYVDNPIYQFLFSTFAFILGAAVGSFLNVCIYRLPLDLSVDEPRRSFCPACKKPIPWHLNLPLISWLVLQGRCANCGSKIAFGKKRIRFDAPTPFTWKRQGDDADFVVGSEQSLWSDHFAREKDRLLLSCNEARFDNHAFGNATLDFHHDRVAVEGHEFMLDNVTEISGVVRELQIPREAMGRGDLKFLAAIGAFLGWRAVLFSLFAGSLLGSIVGLITLVVGKRVWSAKLPFGPYLAFGALSWLFFGDAFLRWYFGFVNPQ